MKVVLPKVILPIALMLLSLGLALAMTLLVQRIRLARPEPGTELPPEAV